MRRSIVTFSSSSRNWSPVKHAQQAKRPPSDPGALPLAKLNMGVGQTDRALFSLPIMCYPAFSPKAIFIIAWGNAPGTGRVT
jgi:hypothetical protein